MQMSWADDGREVDTQGDAFFAVFSSPRACVAAVLEIQQALAAYAWPAGEQVRVRMGVHAGEASKTGAGLVGLEVHRAARVAAVGYGGQVLLSEAAAVLVRDGLPTGVSLEDLGVHRLKDLGRPERIFQLPCGRPSPARRRTVRPRRAPVVGILWGSWSARALPVPWGFPLFLRCRR
jgi:class 3 adenylate cyclase